MQFVALILRGLCAIMSIFRSVLLECYLFVYNIFKLSYDTRILDLRDKNITARKETFCPTPHGVILDTNCEARGKFELNCKYTADFKYSSYWYKDLYTWSSDLR